MKSIPIVIAALALAGCAAPRLELSGSNAHNVDALEAYVPVGMDTDRVLDRMSDAGFTCKVGRCMPGRLSADAAAAGEGAPIDFVWCEKQIDAPVARRWQVMLLLDGRDRVAGHGVTTETLEP